MSEDDTFKLSRNVKSQIESPQDEHRQAENKASVQYKQITLLQLKSKIQSPNPNKSIHFKMSTGTTLSSRQDNKIIKSQ